MYISEESLKESIDYLNELNINNPKTLGDFFLLKYIGVDDSRFLDIDDEFRSKGHEATILMMSLFGSEEEIPENYELMDPFRMEWRSQAVSEGSKMYGRNRLKNNVVGGSTNWRSIVTEEEDRVKFTENYIEELIDTCNLQHIKIDLNALACWVFRNKKIEEGVDNPKQVLLDSFKDLFNITLEEERRLFDEEMDITLSDNKVDMSEIRDYLGDPPEEWVLSDESRKEVELPEIILSEDILIADIELPTTSELYRVLKDYKQAILYGPPGTSKTWLCRKVYKDLDNYSDMEFVQFHPNYSYENFVGGLRPNEEGGFKKSKGPLLEIVRKAKNNREKNYLLIIDEINRANLSKVLGEVFSALDRNYDGIKISGDVDMDSLTMPENLHILGTMNSSDRSIAIVDNALRRRFAFVYTPPSSELLKKKTDDDALDEVSIPLFFEKLNEKIVETLGDKELRLGHTFLMPDSIEEEGVYIWTWEDLEKTINYSIVPLIEEYCSGQEQKMKNILGELWKRPTEEEFKAEVKRVLR